MIESVIVKSYTLPDISRKEVLRYMKAKADDKEIMNLIEQCIAEISTKLEPVVCFGFFDIKIQNSCVKGTDFNFLSSNLSLCLTGSKRVVLFAATIGYEIDRIIKKYSLTDTAKAVCLHAIGAERVEALCDKFCLEIKTDLLKQGLNVTPRFSPGYGDFSINNQKAFFDLLDINKRTGIMLTDNYLMQPSKSVTAVFGIK